GDETRGYGASFPSATTRGTLRDPRRGVGRPLPRRPDRPRLPGLVRRTAGAPAARQPLRRLRAVAPPAAPPLPGVLVVRRHCHRGRRAGNGVLRGRLSRGG